MVNVPSNWASVRDTLDTWMLWNVFERSCPNKNWNTCIRMQHDLNWVSRRCSKSWKGQSLKPDTPFWKSCLSHVFVHQIVVFVLITYVVICFVSFQPRLFIHFLPEFVQLFANYNTSVDPFFLVGCCIKPPKNRINFVAVKFDPLSFAKN